MPSLIIARNVITFDPGSPSTALDQTHHNLNASIGFSIKRSQRYGTQFGWNEDGLNPDTIADESHVDERRSALGMMSLANYSCVLHSMYDSPHPAPAN